MTHRSTNANAAPAAPQCWLPDAPCWTLEPHEVHVWRLAFSVTPNALDRLGALLSPDEQSRAATFHFERDRRRFVCTRGVLRRLLGQYGNLPPERLQFAYSPHGKPRLAESHNEVNLQFNVAHSGDLALLAVARGLPLGIDVEQIRPLAEGEQIARRYFSPREVADYLSLSEADRQAAFFRCWARKEALLKGWGSGLSTPLAAFSVSLLPGEPPFLREAAGLDTRPWRLYDLHPAAGYSAALAVSAAVEVHCRQFDASVDIADGAWQVGGPHGAR